MENDYEVMSVRAGIGPCKVLVRALDVVSAVYASGYIQSEIISVKLIDTHFVEDRRPQDS